jgi:iron complex outermembrane receptor protein
MAANSPAIIAGLTQDLTTRLQGPPFGLTPQQAAAIAATLAGNINGFLGALRPTAAEVGTDIRLGTAPLQATDVRDLGPVEASFNNTFELGYKGIIGNRLRLAIDAYREERSDFGPAGLATPGVHFNSAQLQSYWSSRLQPAISLQLQGAPFNLPQPAADNLAGQFAPLIAGQIAPNISRLPVGVVSFNDTTFANARELFATYAPTDQTIWVSGLDLAADFVANANWTFAATYSWVSDDTWPDVISSNSLPLMLNSPTGKTSLSAAFRSTSGSWGADARLRFTNAYPVNSGVYATDFDFDLPGQAGTYRYDDITSATVFDLGVNWRLQPAGNAMLLSARLENLFDDKYRTMPGLPLIGTMFVTRLQYSF